MMRSAGVDDAGERRVGGLRDAPGASESAAEAEQGLQPVPPTAGRPGPRVTSSALCAGLSELQAAKGQPSPLPLQSQRSGSAQPAVGAVSSRCVTSHPRA